jgi:DNA primase
MGVIDEVKSRLDIVDLVREYVPNLKQAGANWKACCPFHSEKTPSFMVSGEKQIFKCFGCNEGGSVFDFFMKIEGVEFPEALRTLAQRAGVVLQRRDPALENRTTRLLDLIQSAVKFFEANLKEPSAAPVRDYLKKTRGLSDNTIETFHLGLSPEAWSALTEALLKKGFRRDELIASGLVIEKEGRIYDRFRRRIMFPIADLHGNAVGFTGRLLPEDEGKVEAGKYVNTPSTILYDKSRILYGLPLAKTEIRKKGAVILAEGQMDTIAFHQLGFAFAVATSGTALTLEQVQTLKRYASSFILAFDADAAGQEAVKRGIEIALSQGLEVRIFLLPPGIKDPGELVLRSNGAEIIKECLGKTRSILEYYFEKTFAAHNSAVVEGKKAIAKELLSILSKLENRVEQDFYLKQLAQRLEVSEAILREALPAKKSMAKISESPASSSPVSLYDRQTRMCEKALALALRFPNFLPYLVDQLRPEYFEPPELKQWYTSLVIEFTKTHGVREGTFKEFLSHDARAVDLSLRGMHEYGEGMDEKMARSEISQLVKYIKRHFLAKELKVLEQAIHQKEKENSEHALEGLQELLKNFNRLSEQLRGLE